MLLITEVCFPRGFRTEICSDEKINDKLNYVHGAFGESIV